MWAIVFLASLLALGPTNDVDGDGIRGDVDNCPTLSNANQADQDQNDVGDRCDPNTWDFEGDTIGEVPSDVVQLGSAASFLVKDFAGDSGASYDGTSRSVTDRLERLVGRMPQQDVTVYLDLADSNPTTCAFDTSTSGPVAPVNERLRLRLIKGAGTTSQIHVESWDGLAWVSNLAICNISDNHRFRGLGTILASREGGERGVRRITVVREIPQAPFTLRKDAWWSSDWKVFQRDGQDHATIPVRFFYRQLEAGRVQARVVDAGTSSVLPGHDYSDHQLLLPATGAGAAELPVDDVPSGGNYDIEARLVRDSDGAVLGSGTLSQIAVGDVFLAAGQSNMSGRGELTDTETPSSLVHVFRNDGNWARAQEPMDANTDQLDYVSDDPPAKHSLMLRFAKDLQQAIGVPIGLIPGPKGATSLSSDWQRDEAGHDRRSNLYGSQLYRALVQSYTAPVRGFLWFQGENDIGRGVNLYRADLQQLIANYRADLAASGLPFVIAQLGAYSAQNLADRIAIQEAQRQVVAADSGTALVTTIDQPQTDGVHFTTPGYKTIGSRFAAAARNLIYGHPGTPLLELLQARKKAESTRAIELVYDGTVAGGAAALYRVTDGGGSANVTSVTTSGTIVTLNLSRSLQANAFVSYGYSNNPTDPWVKDEQGTPVACFQSVAVAP